MTYPNCVRTAATRAADWLEANRDKHITGTFATKENGRPVHPSAPDAFCFCALGRLAKELDIPCDDDPSEAYPQLDDFDIDTAEVFDQNDRASDRPHKLAADDTNFRAGYGGIEALRRIAEGRL